MAASRMCTFGQINSVPDFTKIIVRYFFFVLLCTTHGIIKKNVVLIILLWYSNVVLAFVTESYFNKII